MLAAACPTSAADTWNHVRTGCGRTGSSVAYVLSAFAWQDAYWQRWSDFRVFRVLSPRSSVAFGWPPPTLGWDLPNHWRLQLGLSRAVPPEFTEMLGIV